MVPPTIAPVCDEEDGEESEEAEDRGAKMDVVAVTCWPLDSVITTVVAIYDVGC